MQLARESVNSGAHFDLAKFDSEIKELSEKSEAEGFWNNSSEALKVISRLNYCKNIAETYRKLENDYKDIEELLELEDDSIFEQIQESFVELKKLSKEFELQILFTGVFDDLNAILEIHPGAGGTEACDWADMLLRMYTMFCDKNNYKYEIISKSDGEEVGIKGCVLLVKGYYPFGYLQECPRDRPAFAGDETDRRRSYARRLRTVVVRSAAEPA